MIFRWEPAFRAWLRGEHAEVPYEEIQSVSLMEEVVRSRMPASTAEAVVRALASIADALRSEDRNLTDLLGLLDHAGEQDFAVPETNVIITTKVVRNARSGHLLLLVLERIWPPVYRTERITIP